MYYKIAQLTQTPGVKGSTIGDVFIAQPDADKEKLAGKLFVLVEIESKSVDNLKIINFLIESLTNNYYQNDKLILRERIKTIKIEYIFESALSKTNKEFAAFLDAEKIKFQPGLINITAGVVFENELYFSSLGKNKALLIFKEKKQTKASTGRRQLGVKKIFEEKETFKIIDIIHKTKEEERISQAPMTTELFSNVISGRLPREGILIFSNEALLEYLSHNQLIKIVSTLPPAGAVEQIKNIFSSVNAYVSFFAILIKNTLGEKEEIKRQILPSSAHGSIANFNIMEERTEKFLAPRGYLSLKKITNYLSMITSLSKRQKLKMGAVSTASGNLIKDKIIFKRKSRFLSFLKILNYPKNIFYGLINFLRYLKTFSTKENFSEFINTTKNKIRTNFFNLIFSFKNLNKKNKTLILIALACFLLLALNMMSANIKNKKTAEQNYFKELVKVVEQKENQLEASLLYKDEKGAKKLAEEIEKLLKQLPQKNKTQILEKNNLLARFDLLVEKIKHIVKLTNLKELANFANLENGAQPTKIILVPAKDKIYSPDENKKIIYSLDINKNAVTVVNNSSLKEQIISLKHPVLDKNNNVYCLNGDKILSLDEKEEMKNFILNPTVALENIADLSFYNNMLYLLDRQDNQIYKFRKEKNSFGARTAWFKEKVDLNNIISMDIDGSIYLLASNGELNKFLKGKKEIFALTAVMPSLAQTTKVIVSRELNYIYIFEPVANRLIVFDKIGKFLLQYQIDNLNNLKDFSINEKKKMIYILADSSVYAGELTHLK